MYTDYSLRTAKELKAMLYANAAEYDALQHHLSHVTLAAEIGGWGAETDLENLTKQMGAVFGRSIFLKLAVDAAKARTQLAKVLAKESPFRG